MSTKEPCYEYFDCKEYDCIRRKMLDTECWEIDDVHCQCHSEEYKRIRKKLGAKLEACKLCLYYQQHNW